jgi:hypothetical protein
MTFIRSAALLSLASALLLASFPRRASASASPAGAAELEPVTPSPSSGGATARRGPKDGDWVVLPLFGAGVSTLRGGYGSLGLGVGQVHGDFWYGGAATVEGGPGGTACLLGAGWIGAEGLAALFGRVAYLRTSERTRGVEAGQDYVGVDVKAMFVLANVSVGLYRHVGGLPDSPGWLGSVGAGFWF